MEEVRLYTKQGCPYCEGALELLSDMDIEFEILMLQMIKRQ